MVRILELDFGRSKRWTNLFGKWNKFKGKINRETNKKIQNISKYY
jgi:hypothetical protein